MTSGHRDTRTCSYGAGTEIAASVLVLGYGVLVDRALPDYAYVPVNLAAAAMAVYLVHRAGASMGEMGLEKERLLDGLKVGLYTVAPIAAVIALGAAIPWTRDLFADTAVTQASGSRAVYEMLVRIPLGTALAEEVIFRGALMGLFLRRHNRALAVTLSSAVFGLWHISPTLHSLSTHPTARSAATGAFASTMIVAGVVAVTAVAGAGLAWLRLKSGSVVAPWIAHTSLNSLSYLAGRITG